MMDLGVFSIEFLDQSLGALAVKDLGSFARAAIHHRFPLYHVRLLHYVSAIIHNRLVCSGLKPDFRRNARSRSAERAEHWIVGLMDCWIDGGRELAANL